MAGLLIVGAGGHASVVADAAKLMDRWEKIAFVDDRYEELKSVSDGNVIGTISNAKNFLAEFSEAVVAIGNNAQRLKMFFALVEQGFRLPTVIHPRAVVSSTASLMDGCVVFANSVINPHSRIGVAGIINTGAMVEHECVLDEAVHVASNATLAGRVRVGKRSWIGMGAAVLQEINIGQDVMVGAGAVVVRDIMDKSTVVGVPAKRIVKNES